MLSIRISCILDLDVIFLWNITMTLYKLLRLKSQLKVYTYFIALSSTYNSLRSWFTPKISFNLFVCKYLWRNISLKFKNKYEWNYWSDFVAIMRIIKIRDYISSPNSAFKTTIRNLDNTTNEISYHDTKEPLRLKYSEQPLKKINSWKNTIAIKKKKR